MNVNLTSPAYPCTPIQDQYNRLVVPNAGINKLEYFALKMLEIYFNEESDNIIAEHEFENDGGEQVTHAKMNFAIDYAITFLNKIEQKTKTPDNEKNSKLVSL